VRKHDEDILIVAVNFTPVTRHDYRIGVPQPGTYREILNSDAHVYGGSGAGNGERTLATEEIPWMDLPYSIPITLPPLAGIVLKPV
jgi:1,4-alpha-glucan branching enzyme